MVSDHVTIEGCFEMVDVLATPGFHLDNRQVVHLLGCVGQVL